MTSMSTALISASRNACSAAATHMSETARFAASLRRSRIPVWLVIYSSVVLGIGR
jgi:hypothetical protein